ncbi:hypothetical protein ACWDHW_40475 [Streptomyces melanosporofaciens]|uniref:hypothetical protein n=1 Tax=unclassified Streptomyces TaxID=2593676 RepID=UPI0036B1C0F5
MPTTVVFGDIRLICRIDALAPSGSASMSMSTTSGRVSTEQLRALAHESQPEATVVAQVGRVEADTATTHEFAEALIAFL